MKQVRSSDLLEQEVTLRESRQPFLGKGLRSPLLPFLLQDRRQLLSRTKIVWSCVTARLQINLGLLQISFAGRQLGQSQSCRRAKGRHTRRGFEGCSCVTILTETVVGNPEVVRDFGIRCIAGINRFEKGLGLFEMQQTRTQAADSLTPLNAIRELGQSLAIRL